MSSHRMKALAGRLFSGDSGNFAINFGLATTVIFLTAGLAVDYATALNKKIRINNALDAASLATGRALSIDEIGTSGTEAEDFFKAIFAANMGDDSFDTNSYTLDSFTIDTDAQTVSAAVSTTQPLTLLRVGTGKTEQTVASYSKVAFGIGSIEVAMVLDVTGSMGSGNNSKLENLKEAAKLGVSELLAANTDTDENVRISLVPYDYGVNVGVLAKYVYPDYVYNKSDAPVYDERLDSSSANYDSNLDPGGYGLGYDLPAYIEDYYVCTKISNGREKVKLKIGDSALDNYSCPSGTPSTDYLPDDFVINDDFTNVDNCATDRKKPYSDGLTNYQYSNANPGSGMISRDSRIADCPDSPLVLLTSDKTTLDNALDGLSGGGYTAGQIGLQWAWYTLSHEWADYFDGTASDPGDMTVDDDLAKFIILMTDGKFNTAYAGTNASAEDVTDQDDKSASRAKTFCTKIKNEGIKIFTIGYETPDSADTMLESCASPDEGTFTYSYEPDSAEELEETYKTIANMIRTLRLTQ